MIAHSPQTSVSPQRILLVRLSHLGDVCHALPVFHALRAEFPGAEIAWVIQPEFAPLIESLPGLDRVFHFARQGGWRAWPRLHKELTAWSPDLTVDAMGNWKSAAVTWCSRAERRLGWHRKDWREPSASRVLTHHAPAAAGMHALEKTLHLARWVAPSQVRQRWDLPLNARELSQGRDWLHSMLPDRGRPRRILHLAAPGDPRSLPASSYAFLAKGLTGAEVDWIMISGPAEADLGRSLELAFPAKAGQAHLVGQRGLRQLAGLLAAAGEEQVRVLCCDSGPCHVAAAVGAAVDLVSGPQDPDLSLIHI